MASSGTRFVFVSVARLGWNLCSNDNENESSTGLSDEERVSFVRPKKFAIKKIRKNTTQKIETVKYKVLFDHIFSDRNYSKVYKFCRYTISPSFLIIFCSYFGFRNLKDELNRSYNGGVVVYLLQSELSMENA